MADISRPEVREKISTWNWPEMQYATHRWSGQWKNVDLRFCSFNGYPAPSAVFGIHFSGLKPWSLKNEEAVRRFSRYEDFQCWFREFRAMTEEHPQLLRFGRLQRLLALVESLAA
jgi:glycogenin glucosyltransferase